MKVHDSVYRTLDWATKSIISNLLQTSTITELVQTNRQAGGQDCGVSILMFHIYVAGAFRNDELFRIRNSSQEVGKYCRYNSVCNSEAISPILLKHGHFVHRGVFLLPKLEPSKTSFVWQSYG